MPTIKAQIPHPYVPQVSSAATQGALAIYGRSVEESLRRLEVSVNALTTTDIPEGSNLYYTDARARAALSGTAPITYNSGTGAIGANAASANTFNYLVQRDGTGGFLAGAVTVTNLTNSALTLGSVVFAGTGGLLSQDNALTFDGIKIIVSGSATDSSGKFGSFEIQSYSVNNAWLGENAYFDGANFRYRSNGYASLNYFASGGWYVRIAASGIAGNVASFTETISHNNAGLTGLGVVIPTAKLHIAASTGSPSDAPLKFETGILLSPVENGAVEFNGTNLYLTAGGVRSLTCWPMARA